MDCYRCRGHAPILILDIPGHQLLHHFLYEGQMPKFQTMNFCYVTLLTHLVLKWLKVFFGNLSVPTTVCTCNSSFQKNMCIQHVVFYAVLISCCAQNIRNISCSLIVEGMFQNAFRIALYNKCHINIIAVVLFKNRLH